MKCSPSTICIPAEQAAIMVLAERRIRYVIIKKLDAETAFAMHNAKVKSLENHPPSIRRSIMYDNDTGNALHELTNGT